MRRNKMIRKRISKDYEVRVCWYTTDSEGDWSNGDLIDMMPISDFCKDKLSDYKDNLENDDKLSLEISERFYVRYSSDDEWEFVEDELWGIYDEEYGWDIDSCEIPLWIKKKLNKWHEQQS